MVSYMHESFFIHSLLQGCHLHVVVGDILAACCNIYGGFHVDKNKHDWEIISFCTVIPDKMGLEDDSNIIFLISHRKH